MRNQLARVERELEFRHKASDAAAVELAEIPEDEMTDAAAVAERAGYAEGFAAGMERALEMLASTECPRHLRVVK